MESTGEVSNVEQKNLYNGLLHKKILLMFDTSPVVSIWLKMSINWHTKSQGPKKKCTHFSRGRIHSCPAGTARNQGSFTSMALWSVQSFLSSTVYTRTSLNYVYEVTSALPKNEKSWSNSKKNLITECLYLYTIF